MAFLQSCIIRKNTPELRKKLEELGYEPCHPMTLHPDLYKHIYVYTFWGDIYYGLTEIENDVVEAMENKRTIDCGDNEEMFLALAALRDDTAKNQWFIVDDLWIKSSNDIPDKYVQMHGDKATIEEIIEHFNK
jgi:hypothetical protein